MRECSAFKSTGLRRRKAYGFISIGGIEHKKMVPALNKGDSFNTKPLLESPLRFSKIFVKSRAVS